MDIAAWLVGLGLERYAQTFQDNEIDGEVLPTLTAEDLKDLGVEVIGHRRRLLNAIAALADGDSHQGAATPTPRAEAERRQLTVMFCDLVGSTALSAQLDPEDMREVIRGYQDACAGVIMRFDGFVAKYMGDGVLAYFGYPRAHEDDAERAVRAGLALTEAVTRLATPTRQALAARIGIATGLVVVGDLVGEGASQEQAVVGDTPNLAARLQGFAEPGQVVIADATRRLLGTGFELSDLGPVEIKGLASVTAFAVIGEKALASRFEAHGGQVLPMIGRDHELALLLERWTRAKAAEGQGVLLVGEAGIGKSRITRALLDALEGEPHTRIRYQCSPYHTDSALWPVTRQLTHVAGFEAGDTAADKLDKLEAVLARAGDGDRATPLVADLMGLDASARYGPLDLTPAMKRVRLLEALVGQLLGLAARQAVIMVFEDVHWVDPTTLELIEQFLDRIPDARVLVLLTSRPDQQPALAGHPHVTRLTLNRLGRTGVEEIVTRLRGEVALPDKVIDAIISRTDGVPLFVEELTKAILETDEASIPASLHDSLMARLDRIPEVKEVAQVAACIGRGFDHALLAAIADRPESDLTDALERLVSAELIFRRGSHPHLTYSFKHALVRDAAYQSLLKSRRQVIHERILEALQHRDEASPELLGHHAESGGLLQRAIGYWHQAGLLAIDRSAYREATRHHEHVLQIIAQLPERPELLERGIDTRLDLRNCLVPLGHAQRALDLAREAAALAERLNDEYRRARAASYVSIMQFHVGAPQEGLALGREAVERASRFPDTDLQVSSRFFLGQVHQALGHYGEARQLYNQVVADLAGDRLYDRCGLPFLPASHARAYLTLVLAEQGDFAAGSRIGSEAVRVSEHADHPFSLQQACWALGLLHLRQGDHARALALMERAIALTRSWGLDVWYGPVASTLGVLRALSGDVEDGISLLEDAVRTMENPRNSSFWLGQGLISLARAYQIAGRVDDAMGSAERALAKACESQQAGDEAWALHLQGEIARRAECADPERIRQSFRQSLSMAHELGMRPLDAHCTLGLALVDQANGDKRQAAKGMRRAIATYHELAMHAPEAQARASLDSLC